MEFLECEDDLFDKAGLQIRDPYIHNKKDSHAEPVLIERQLTFVPKKQSLGQKILSVFSNRNPYSHNDWAKILQKQTPK